MKKIIIGLIAACVFASYAANDAADARVIYRHKCRINGVWHKGPCPSVYNGRRTVISCVKWRSPHAHRHHGRCRTPG